MSRASGAGAYSHGTACPSPRPQLDGALVSRPTESEVGRLVTDRSLVVIALPQSSVK